MLAEIPWWFYWFVLPELVIGGIGLIVFLIASVASGAARR